MNPRTNFNRDFDRDFDKAFTRTRRLAVGVVIFNAVLILSVLGGVAFVAYKVLVHFGIL